jgi:hypothetical protein
MLSQAMIAAREADELHFSLVTCLKIEHNAFLYVLLRCFVKVYPAGNHAGREEVFFVLAS